MGYQHETSGHARAYQYEMSGSTRAHQYDTSGSTRAHQYETSASTRAHQYEAPASARGHGGSHERSPRAPVAEPMPAATAAAAVDTNGGITKDALDVVAEEVSIKRVEALLAAREDTKDLARRETLLQLAGSSKVRRSTSGRAAVIRCAAMVIHKVAMMMYVLLSLYPPFVCRKWRRFAMRRCNI